MGQITPSSRLTSRIGQKAAQTLYYAVGEHAERIGLPFTRHVTINFALAGTPPAHATRVFERIRRNHFDKWARRPCNGAGRPFLPTWAYVFENSRDGVAFTGIADHDPNNVHVHWLVHLPPTRFHDFNMRLSAWLDLVCGFSCPPNAIMMTEVFDTKGMRRYFLTGTAERWAGRYGARFEDQGIIVGKRAGTSRNLGPTARRALDKALGISRRAA